MPAATQVNLRAARKQLGRQIAEAENAVKRGTLAVVIARKEGRKRDAEHNAKTVKRARSMLRKLQRHEASLADDCCDKQTQNCDFVYR